MTRVLLCASVLALAAVQAAEDPESLRKKLGDVELGGRWIYGDLNAGFAEAARTGKPLAVFLRCVP
ncbi:MAG TPA: hypothetical protein VEK08_07990 [Planctomycetota bacterium]|nr:hypothetical protein [Planctomycetota bacterium]